MTDQKHFLMTGGGTLGSVTPLLAIAAELRKRDAHTVVSWVGTPNGPERLVVESNRIAFYSLSSPKLNRYKKWLWPLLPFGLAVSVVRAFSLLRTLRPAMVFTAGSFVSVPVVLAAWVLRIPVWVHQLDVQPGVANKIMAYFAKRISVTFDETAVAFPSKKTLVVGGMFRHALRLGDKQTAVTRYGFDATLPTVLVMGGGTGAVQINDAMATLRRDMVTHANVLHLVGRGKMLSALEEQGQNYTALEFLNEGMADAYAAADIVVCRSGLGTICELAALGKPAIIIPFHSFEFPNAKALEERNAAEVLWYMTPQILSQAITRLLEHPERRDELSKNVRALFALNADERIVHETLLMLV
ncbi:MAG: UDP-N-acetylglucosamine--N-acetylmuramyl-(pentapeptide) pyrophosphoryl-undecaprenol N-acetylglucosamine transferase [Patescibacteria group bacterium]